MPGDGFAMIDTLDFASVCIDVIICTTEWQAACGSNSSLNQERLALHVRGCFGTQHLLWEQISWKSFVEWHSCILAMTGLICLLRHDSHDSESCESCHSTVCMYACYHSDSHDSGLRESCHSTYRWGTPVYVMTHMILSHVSESRSTYNWVLCYDMTHMTLSHVIARIHEYEMSLS